MNFMWENIIINVFDVLMYLLSSLQFLQTTWCEVTYRKTQPSFPFPSKPENIPSVPSVLLKGFACSSVPVIC